VLEMAKEWGTPPWEIAAGSKMLWYQRWLALRAARYYGKS
jgi:hypothetical protein